MLLYLISSIFVVYIAFNIRNVNFNPLMWNVIFWIIILFTAANSIAKSFIQEHEDTALYLYYICHPGAVIISKIIYNSILMLGLISTGLIIYSMVFGFPIQDLVIFGICMVLSSLGFGASFTMISSIASKASNSSTMMAILGFPIILPILLLIIKLSFNAIDGLGFSASYDEITTLIAIIVIAITSSVLLFPYLWRTS